MHAEQLSRTGATRLGVVLGAASCDHLEQVNAADIWRWRNRGRWRRCCRDAIFIWDWRNYAPARKLIEAGAIVALATDYNPGTSPTMSMPMILSLACTQLRMTPAEAIAAATINARLCPAEGETIGSLEVGKAGGSGRVRGGGLPGNSLLFWDEPVLDDDEER